MCNYWLFLTTIANIIYHWPILLKKSDGDIWRYIFDTGSWHLTDFFLEGALNKLLVVCMLEPYGKEKSNLGGRGGGGGGGGV